MAARAVTIPLRVKADSSIQRTLRGVTVAARKATAQELSDAKRAATEKRRAEAKAEKAKEHAIQRALAMQMAALKAEKKANEKSAKAAAQAAKRQADREIKESERAAKAQMKHADQVAKWRVRMQLNSARIHERTERARAREAQKAMREIERAESASAQRRRQVLGAIGGGIAGAVVGAAGAAINYAQGAKGRTGVQDHGDTLLTAKQIHENLIRQMTQAGKSREEIRGTVQTIDSVANKRRVPQEELAQAISTAQSRFSDLEGGFANLDLFAQAARAWGESTEKVTEMALTHKQVFGLTDDQVADKVREMMVQASKGSIEAKDIANTFAPSVATFAAKVGAKGSEESSQISALAQVLGTSLKNPAEVATIMERLGSKLADKNTQKKLRKYGIDIANEKTGEIDVSTAEIVDMIATSPAMQSPVIRQEVFSDLLAEQGAATLVTALRDNPDTKEDESLLYRSIANATPEEGQAIMDEVTARLDESPFADIDKMNIEAQSVTLLNKKSDITGEGYVDTQVKTARAAHDLQLKDPTATEAAGPVMSLLSSIGLGTAGGVLLSKIPGMLGFGGTAGAAGAGAGATGGLAATGGKSLLARGAGLGAQGLRSGAAWLAGMGPPGWIALAGAAAAAGTYAWLGDDAEDIGARFYDWSHGGNESMSMATRFVADPNFEPRIAPVSQPASGETVIASLAEQTAAKIDIGKGEIRIKVDGPGHVVGTKQTDNMPAFTVDNGSMSSRL